MTQNIYDNDAFFANYAQLPRSVHGLDGAPEWPMLASMLPDMRGASVVDLGCGYGWFCRYAKEQGAARVTGLDVSEKMLARARELTADSGIVYEKADLESAALPARAHDLVYSSLTLHYIKDLPRLFKTVRGTLKPGGFFIFSAEHPIFTAPRRPGWLEGKNGEKSWPVDNYQAEGDRVTDWLAEGVVKRHRKLATYVNCLLDSGFALARLEEWGPSDRQVADWPALAEERERPMIFLLSAKAV